MQLPGEFSPFIEKKVVFCLVVRPLKKPLFLCVSSLTHLLTYSLTHLLTYSLTHSLTHLLTYSLTHLLTYSLTHLLTFTKCCKKIDCLNLIELTLSITCFLYYSHVNTLLFRDSIEHFSAKE